MAVSFSPIFNSQSVNGDGDPAVGWKVYSYVVNSATPLATYTTEAGDVEQSNPIVLNALGFPTTGQIWLTSNTAYKLVLTDENDVVQKTEDNILGVPEISATQDEWVASGLTPTYVSGTSFTLAGDQTTVFNVGRRLKTTNTGGTIYSRIKSSVFGATTTITVANDSGTLDSGLSAVSYGLLSATNPSTPLLADTYPIVSGSADKTKLVRIEADGLTTDTTRVLTVADNDGTILTTGNGQATQADQETGTSTTTYVTPGRQQFHPAAAKFWVAWATTGTTISVSYNVTSVTNTGVGDELVTVATDFSTANWVCVGTAASGGGTNTVIVNAGTKAAGTQQLLLTNSPDAPAANALADSTMLQVVGFGDQ